jgi:hypothetical protein
MLCLRLQVNWALGALLSEVLQQGGHAVGRAHDHIMLSQILHWCVPSFKSQLANQLTCCVCMLCLCLQVNWALAALLSKVFQQGGQANTTSAAVHACCDCACRSTGRWALCCPRFSSKAVKLFLHLLLFVHVVPAGQLGVGHCVPLLSQLT